MTLQFYAWYHIVMSTVKTKRCPKKLSSPQQTKRAVGLLAAGHSEREVARAMGCHQSSVQGFKKKNKELIEKEQQRFLEVMPTAVDTAINLIREYNDPKKRAKLTHLVQGHAHVHTMEALRTFGIYQSTGQPQIIENLTITEDNRSITVNVASKEEIFDRVMELVKQV